MEYFSKFVSGLIAALLVLFVTNSNGTIASPVTVICYDTVTVTVYDTIKVIDTSKVDEPIKPDTFVVSKLPQHVQDYINANYPIAREVADSFGLDWLYILAQPAIESGWGTSRIALKGNNLFGIKKMKRFPSIGRYTKFPDIKTGFKEYCRLINKYRKDAVTTEEIAYVISRSKYVSKEKQTIKSEADRYMNKVLKAAQMIQTHLNLQNAK